MLAARALAAIFGGMLVWATVTFASMGAWASATASLASPPNVFDKDDRVAMLDWKHPWSAIGRVGSAGNWYCSGVVVGRDLVLTNAHCLFMQDGSVKEPPAMWFIPNFKRGKVKYQVNVVSWVAGTRVPQSDWANDWAILKVDRNIGDRFGIIEPMVIDYAKLEQVRNSVTLAGYSKDFRDGETAGVHENCSLIKLAPGGTLMHDCDATGGSSGGPIFMWSKKARRYVVVAINSFATAHVDADGTIRHHIGVPFSEERPNFAVPASSFIDAVKQARGAAKKK